MNVYEVQYSYDMTRDLSTWRTNSRTFVLAESLFGAIEDTLWTLAAQGREHVEIHQLVLRGHDVILPKEEEESG